MKNIVKSGKININNLGEDNIMKQNLRLTKSEKEIMDKFWENEEGFTCTELVDASPDRSWRRASAHLLINSLLEKEFIEVFGFRKSTKNYARIFKAKFSYEDYAIKVIMANSTADSRKKLTYKLINEATLEELEEMKVIIESQIIMRKSKEKDS